MSEKTKYNYGVGIKLDEVPKEEMSLAISQWAEGNKNLENAIISCIESGIPTIASCAGDSIMDLPYIAMQINKQNVGNILNLINRFSNETHTQMALCFDNDIATLTIYANRINKNKCFKIIEEEAKNSLDFEEVNELTKSLWNTHVTLRNHGRLYNDIQYINGSMKKSLLITSYSTNYELKRILLEEINMKPKSIVFGTKVMTKSSIGNKKIIKTLDDITHEVQETFVKNPVNWENNDKEEIEKVLTEERQLSFDDRIKCSSINGHQIPNQKNAKQITAVQKELLND